MPLPSVRHTRRRACILPERKKAMNGHTTRAKRQPARSPRRGPLSLREAAAELTLTETAVALLVQLGVIRRIAGRDSLRRSDVARLRRLLNRERATSTGDRGLPE